MRSLVATFQHAHWFLAYLRKRWSNVLPKAEMMENELKTGKMNLEFTIAVHWRPRPIQSPFLCRACVKAGASGHRLDFFSFSKLIRFGFIPRLKEQTSIVDTLRTSHSWGDNGQMNNRIDVDNPCNQKKDFCVNCHSHFMAIRPLIKNVVVSKHFIRDLKDEEQRNSIIKDVLDCSHLSFNELHKFEEHVNGNLVFRAKKGSLHIVYCVNKKTQIILFLRAIKHFSEYRRFLENKRRLKKLIGGLS